MTAAPLDIHRGNGRQPDQAVDPLVDHNAEVQVLGALVLGEPWALQEILRSDDARPLRAGDFTSLLRAQVWRAVVDLDADGVPVEPLAIASRLQASRPEAVATEATLIELAQAGATSLASLLPARDRLIDLGQRRELRQTCQRTLRELERGASTDALAAHHEALVDISDRRQRSRPLSDRWGAIGPLDHAPEPARWLFRLPTRDGDLAPPGGGDGFLRRGCVASIVGPGGAGKTMALLDAAIAVTTGGRWLDYFPVEGGPGRALAFVGEEDLAEVRRRVYRATRHLEPDQRRLVERNLVVLPMKGRRCGLLRPGDAWPEPTRILEDLMARLQDESDPAGWSLVVLEPLSRVAGVPLDVATDNATAVIEVAERICEVPGTPAVFLGIHSNKASRREGERVEVRGPSGLTDGVRAELHLYRDKGRLFLHAAKTNYSPFMPPPGVELTVGEHGVLRAASVQVTEDPAAVSARVRADALAKDVAAILGALATGPASSIDAAVTRAGINLQRGRAAFRVALDDGRIVDAGTSKKPAYRVGGETPHTPRPDVGRPGPLEAAGRPERPGDVSDVVDVDDVQMAGGAP